MRPAVLPVLLALALAGCTGSSDDPTPAGSDVPNLTFEQPEASAFKAGTCQTVAEPVLSAGRDAQLLGPGGSPPPDVIEDLTAVQKTLDAVKADDPALGKQLNTLVVSIGLVRIRSEGDEYGPELGQQLSAAYDAVLATCT